MEKSIYTQAVELMNESEISSHQSDLYLKVTDVSKKLIDKYLYRSNVRKFNSQIDHCLWYEIPFAYDPYWEKLQPKPVIQKKRIYVQKDQVHVAKMLAFQISGSMTDYDFILPNVFEISSDWHHREFEQKLINKFQEHEVNIISQ